MAPSAGADGERTAARAEDGSASCPAAGPVPDSDSLRPESQHASPGEEKGDTVGPRAQPVKRKKKDKTAALLSFGDELEEDGDGSAEFGSISQSTTKRQACRILAGSAVSPMLASQLRCRASWSRGHSGQTAPRGMLT